MNRNIIFFFQFFFVFEKIHFVLCFMSFISFQTRYTFIARISKKKIVVIMFCIRCARDQKKCRLFSLSRKYEKCVRVKKKCESSMSLINFDDIDKTINKLSREETKIEIALKIASDLMRLKLFKLKRFREQKRFSKEREQKMFDKNFDDVKKLKCLKAMKKVARKIVDLENLNDFFALDVLSSNAINWVFLKNSFNDENVIESSHNNFYWEH